MNKLYLIPTPIGNINEVSKRSLELFSSINIFLCEDTRVTKKLFDLLNIERKNKRFISYHKFNETKRINEVLDIIKENNVALVSDAGAPTINDPGYIIVKSCIEKNIEIAPISGPSSLINMIMGSGINMDKFSYVGFLPKKKNELEKLFKDQFSINNKILFLLSVHQFTSTLKLIDEIYPTSKISIGKELTKSFEKFLYGTSKEIYENHLNPKGEYIGIIESSIIQNDDQDKKIISRITELKSKDICNKEILYTILNEYPKSKKNNLYNLIYFKK